jgi:Tfp pilus assembly protein PilW
MSPSNAKLKIHPRRRGFTLVELIVSVSLSIVVFAGILAGFTFLGRNLTRLVNTQGQDVSSRRAFYLFSRDISLATAVSNATNTSLSLTLPTTSGSTTTVAYAYNTSAGTLSRVDGSNSTVLLSNLTALDFNYFNKAGTSITPSPLSVKEVELTFTSAVGDSSSGTQARYTAVSPRLVLRNKPLLQ